MAYSPLGAATRKEWLERVKAETSKKRAVFFCAVCGHGPLPRSASARCKAE